jgi:hypothetical protein
MDSSCSLHHSQQNTTGQYSEPYPSSPHPKPISFLSYTIASDLSWIIQESFSYQVQTRGLYFVCSSHSRTAFYMSRRYNPTLLENINDIWW